jgi:Mrp family chromosome partitioning ATPase
MLSLHRNTPCAASHGSIGVSGVRLCTCMSLLNKACVAKNEHWMVQQPLDGLFIGRSELIAQIQSAIRTDDPGKTKQKRLVITGMGGIGKSELCLRIANDMRQE